MTQTDDLAARLARHRALGPAPAREHAWLAEHGTLRALAAGEVLAPKGVIASSLWILLSGHLVIYVDRGAGPRMFLESRSGDVTGALPYSRGARPPADLFAEEASDVIGVASSWLPELIRECPVVTEILVHEMIDRSRQVTSGDLRDEKLLSLGKLAAGLAHELNNPASAAVRSAKRLTDSIAAAATAARRLGAARLSDSQLAAIDALLARRDASPGSSSLSTVARADREDATAEWLVVHDADDERALALAEAGVTPDSLDALAASLDGDALDAALEWVAADSMVRALAAEIETAAERIHDLVRAVKGFTYMDLAPTLGPVDIGRGIADTLTMLGAKQRAKSVQVSVELPDDLPRALAVGGELNQVWMNLIDNALDAVATGGHVEVTAGRSHDRVVVRIVDDGPGVPPELQARIFEPFFTTKGVGEGTGLGLDIVRRLLQRHDGGIELESRPGRTEFRVVLKLEDGRSKMED